MAQFTDYMGERSYRTFVEELRIRLDQQIADCIAAAMESGVNQQTIETAIQEFMSTYSYNSLQDKPSINSVELIGDRSLGDIGINSISLSTITSYIEEFWSV